MHRNIDMPSSYLVPTTDQARSKLGMERVKEDEMGAEEETTALNSQSREGGLILSPTLSGNSH